MDYQKFADKSARFAAETISQMAYLNNVRAEIREDVLKYIKEHFGKSAFEDYDTDSSLVLIQDNRGNNIVQKGFVLPVAPGNTRIFISLWDVRCNFVESRHPLNESDSKKFKGLIDKLKPFPVFIESPSSFSEYRYRK